VISFQGMGQGKKRFSKEDRKKIFWLKVDKKGPDECWEFIGRKDAHGYGHFETGTKTMRAHRYAYEISHDIIIPYGKYVLHKCDNPSCVNPAHLFLGTQSDNMKDMDSKNRRGAMTNTDKISFAQTTISAENIIKIRKLLKTKKFSQRFMAKIFRVSQPTICKIGKPYKYPCKEGYFV